jgi:hypothetical protein
MTKNGKQPGVDRLNDKHIARLVKRAALAASVRGISTKLTEGGDLRAFPARRWSHPPMPMSTKSSSNSAMPP